jgi:hypothetical protein
VYRQCWRSAGYWRNFGDKFPRASREFALGNWAGPGAGDSRIWRQSGPDPSKSPHVQKYTDRIVPHRPRLVASSSIMHRSWRFHGRWVSILSPFWRISPQEFRIPVASTWPFLSISSLGGWNDVIHLSIYLSHINLFDCRQSGDQGTPQMHSFSPARGRIYFFIANLAIYRH